MADGCGPLMTRFFDRPDATSAFLERATTSISVDDSAVTSAISPDDVGAALEKLKRGQAAGLDEINNSFYRCYADVLATIFTALCTRWMDCDVFPTSVGDASIQCLKKSSDSALPLDRRSIALLNND